jgi:hypothetical protein
MYRYVFVSESESVSVCVCVCVCLRLCVTKNDLILRRSKKFWRNISFGATTFTVTTVNIITLITTIIDLGLGGIFPYTNKVRQAFP